MNKNLILAALFLVTWNEYELKSHHIDGVYQPTDCKPDGKCWGLETLIEPQDFNTVETTTHTVKLATQEDVDRFKGYDGPCRDNPPVKPGFQTIQSVAMQKWCEEEGIISKDAYNIKVEEVK
jgi:hypothetical protein